VISAVQIADALGLPHPTEQQRAVIESSPTGPALVIAGAGSGKTETMASRVLWLLANGHVEPGGVLGLTFTRKAAGELSVRIQRRIRQLTDAGLLAVEHDEFVTPTVATYNSFANSLYRDHAVLIGRDSDGTVLSEASAWQLARSLVVGSTDERLIELGKNVDVVTRAVLELSHAMSENVADPDDVRSMAARFAGLAELPPGGRGEYEEAARLATTVGALDVLVDLADRFRAEKARRSFVEYADQVALALEIVDRAPRVADQVRAQHRVVLLDEYQDTSVVQTWLLARLFGEHPVMAVGDPNQSIYGWRGASAANLDDFATQFGSGSHEVARFSLSTSWRNGHDILRIANALVDPLRDHAKVDVERLDPRPGASALPVDVSIVESVVDEARITAEWIEQRMRVAPGSEVPSAAILFRTRKTQGQFMEALRERGIPFHVLGLGGLLAEPEIADLVSALRVLGDPTAGSELVRLLAGSRWRIGPRDLFQLSRVASWLYKRDYATRALDDVVVQGLRNSVAEGEGGSIVDALDFLATAKPGHTQLEAFSPVGLERLREAGSVFARLRGLAGLDLLDYVTAVEQDFQLDIEVVANDYRALGGANREAFFDALASYLTVDDSASLPGFLSWLREAEWRDNLSPRPEDPEPGTVQLLTIHGSKGLEWDIVAVPRWVDDDLPARPREGFRGWLSFGSLPWEFRGDRAELPALAWDGVESRKEFIDAVDDFKALVRERSVREERRLAYVAVTRARNSLLLTGSFWANGSRPRQPSILLRELVDRGELAPISLTTEFEENPLGDRLDVFTWPLDPLGGRRSRVEAAAELVCSTSPGSAGRWEHDLDLLLEERRRRMTAAERIPLPARVPASRFKDFVTDPASVARSLRRPMPERPYRATRLGTLFHSWVENRYGIGGTSEELDAPSIELDDGEFAESERLAELQATFERSPWARRAPVDVEREIHLVLDGQVVVCKIDAVYELPAASDGRARFEIVDWKTGKAPKDAADLEAKQFQLALYRLAYARWKGIEPDRIDAVFYFVADDAIVRPERIFDEDELVAAWRGSLTA
jgi:DNA helicase-2/ATP-dependent DNA helicase PcrA